MLSLDPLQPRREALQAQHSVLIEKLSELRYSYGFSADTSTKFQLKKQIEQVESDLEVLEQQLVSSRANLNRWTALSGAPEARVSKAGADVSSKFVLNHPIAAFLIHGKVDYGQQWLLNRLDCSTYKR